MPVLTKVPDYYQGITLSGGVANGVLNPVIFGFRMVRRGKSSINTTYFHTFFLFLCIFLSSLLAPLISFPLPLVSLLDGMHSCVYFLSFRPSLQLSLERNLFLSSSVLLSLLHAASLIHWSYSFIY